MRLAHLGYVVKNMQSSLKRFIAEGGRCTIEPAADPIQKVEVCLIEMPGGADIELVCPTHEDSPVIKRLEHGGGLDHICYYVDDVAQAIQNEESKGALVVSPPVPACVFNRTVGFVYRRSGLVVEFMSEKEV